MGEIDMLFSEKGKKILMIVLMLLGSGFFLFEGFSMLAQEGEKAESNISAQ